VKNKPKGVLFCGLMDYLKRNQFIVSFARGLFRINRAMRIRMEYLVIL
jgi:hypothetical protein